MSQVTRESKVFVLVVAVVAILTVVVAALYLANRIDALDRRLGGVTVSPRAANLYQGSTYNRFGTMTETYEANQRLVEHDNRLAERLLAHPVAQPRVATAPDADFVHPLPRTVATGTCVTLPGATLTEIGVDPDSDRTLVRYTLPPEELRESVDSTTDRCLDGAIFFVSS